MFIAYLFGARFDIMLAEVYKSWLEIKDSIMGRGGHGANTTVPSGHNEL
jgi:hypothetical protein